MDDEAGVPVLQHAAKLRSLRLFAEVREAFWKQEPQLKKVLADLTAARVFLVPFFISEGYFSAEVIPHELGFSAAGSGEFPRVRRRGGQVLVYCQPVGAHSVMGEVLLARARDVVQSFPFPRAPKPQDLTLFIAGHGTEQSENSRKTIDRQVQAIRALGLYAEVHGLFLEEAPRVADWYQLASTRNVVIVPFFISDGPHVRQDIPVLLGEPERLVQQRWQQRRATWRNPSEKRGKLVWYASAVGTDPRLAEVILEQVREVAQKASSGGSGSG